jgi:hypothetical protein
MGYPIASKELSIQDFERVALEAQPSDDGYADYIHSVVGIFQGLRDGKYEWHKHIFRVEFEAVMKRKPLSFFDWLETSRAKSRLTPTG